MRALAMATLMVAGLGVTADAEKFSHQATVKLHVELSDRVKAPPVKADAPARPTIDGDTALHIEGLVGEIRKEQEQVLKELIRTAPDSDPQKPDYYFLLGELYAKEHRAAHLLGIKAQLDHDDRAAAAQAKAAKDALVGAVRTYKDLADNLAYRNYPQMDTALFYYGYTLQSGNYPDEARAVYDRLLKEYPNSKYVPDALFVFAERYFELGQLADAEARYRKVLKFPKSSVYWFAMYKLGWVELNTHPEAALETFYQVARGTTDAAHAALHREAEKDFVRAYAEVGKADKALPAFERIDKPRALDLLATLADRYVDQGKADRAIYVLRELLVRQPKSPRVCAWQYNIAREMLTAGTRADQLAEIEGLTRMWVALRANHAFPKAEAEDCEANAAEMSGTLARAYHQEAAKTLALDLFDASDRLYRAYLAAFPAAADAAETRYFHAELLWARAKLDNKNPRLQTERWKDAADAFTAAIEGGKLDAKLVKVSADAAMQAWMNALAVDPRNYQVKIPEEAYDTVPVPKPIPALDTKLLAAFDVYLHYVTDPKDEELVDVKFQKANLLRRYDHLPEALAIYEDILAHNRNHDAAETSAELALDSYNRLHRFPEMLALAGKLRGDAKFMDGKPELEGTIAKLQRQALRKAAEAQEAEAKRTGALPKFVDCANTFLDAYNAAPLADDADTVLYNAGVCYEEGKSLSAAKEVFVQLQKLYPKSTLTAKSLVRLGNIYAQAAYYREAAKTFEAYAAKYAGEHDAHDALSDAVGYRKGVGDDAQAIADTETYIRMFGKTRPAAAAEAYWSLTAIYEKQADLDKLAHHLRAYIDHYGSAGGADRLVTAWSKLGDALWRKSCPVALVDGSCARVARELSLVRVRAPRSHGPKTCGDDTKIHVTPVARDARLVAASLDAYTKAVAAWDKRGGKVGGDERGALYFYALARMAKAERDYESYLAVPIPSGLDFDPRKPAVAAAAQKKFGSWFEKKLALGKSTREEYDAVIALGDGATAIASAARLGQISQSFAGQLFHAEIPANLREGPYAEDASQAYCDEVGLRVDPLEEDAIASYQACLKTSTRLGWFSDASRICERELGQLDPQHWPTASELRRDPDAVSMITRGEPPPGL